MTQLVRALLREKNDKWRLQCRHLQPEKLQLQPKSAARLAAAPPAHESNRAKTHDSYTTRRNSIQRQVTTLENRCASSIYRGVADPIHFTIPVLRTEYLKSFRF